MDLTDLQSSHSRLSTPDLATHARLKTGACLSAAFLLFVPLHCSDLAQSTALEMLLNSWMLID